MTAALPLPARWRRVARAVVRRLFAAALAALVLVTALAAGRTYLWCSMMEAAVETCCCEPEGAGVEAASSEGAELRSACCEHRGHDELTKGRVATTVLEVPAAIPVAPDAAAPVVVVAPLASWVPAEPPAAVRASPIRAGPRTASEICVELQVFRC